jgi:hypothetical protein
LGIFVLGNAFGGLLDFHGIIVALFLKKSAFLLVGGPLVLDLAFDLQAVVVGQHAVDGVGLADREFDVVFLEVIDYAVVSSIVIMVEII